MKLGGTLKVTLTEDEIIEKLLVLWHDEIDRGVRGGPELFRSVCADTLRFFVREKKEGATLFMRRFTDKYTFEDMLPLLQAEEALVVNTTTLPPFEEDNTAPTEAATESETDQKQKGVDAAAAPEQPVVIHKVSEVQLKLLRIRQRARRKRMIGILLFLLACSLFAWSTRYLDRYQISLSLDEIPDLLLPGFSTAEEWSEANTQLARDSWDNVRLDLTILAAAMRFSEGQKQWDLAFKSRDCEATLRRLEDRQPAAHALRTFAQHNGYVLLSPVAERSRTFMYLRYATNAHIASANAREKNSQREGRLETGISALPEGIGAAGIIRTRFTTSDLTTDIAEIQPTDVVGALSGTTLFCKQATLYGWYFERSRYVP